MSNCARLLKQPFCLEDILFFLTIIIFNFFIKNLFLDSENFYFNLPSIKVCQQDRGLSKWTKFSVSIAFPTKLLTKETKIRR